jgi:hypothetical protein
MIDPATVVMQWQPIETAPKDSGFLLVCGGNNSINLVFWDLPGYADARWSDVYGEEADMEGITHWLQIPMPPIVEYRLMHAGLKHAD